MMAILGRDQVYMIDRDNAVFKISGLQDWAVYFLNNLKAAIVSVLQKFQIVQIGVNFILFRLS